MPSCFWYEIMLVAHSLHNHPKFSRILNCQITYWYHVLKKLTCVRWKPYWGAGLSLHEWSGLWRLFSVLQICSVLMVVFTGIVDVAVRIGRRPVRCVGGDISYILRHLAPSDTLVQRRREMTDFPSKSCSFLLRKPKKKNMQIRCLVDIERKNGDGMSSLPCFGSN